MMLTWRQLFGLPTLNWSARFWFNYRMLYIYIIIIYLEIPNLDVSISSSCSHKKTVRMELGASQRYSTTLKYFSKWKKCLSIAILNICQSNSFLPLITWVGGGSSLRLLWLLIKRRVCVIGTGFSVQLVFPRNTI